MDSIDDAQAIADMFLKAAITNARSKGRALPPKGTCYYCDSFVPHQGLFCDKDCADDYEKLQRKQKNTLE